MKIEIYNKCQLLGIGEVESPPDSCIALDEVEINGKNYNIIRILDMDYAMVIPDHIAEKMTNMLENIDDTLEEHKIALDNLNKMEERNGK